MKNEKLLHFRELQMKLQSLQERPKLEIASCSAMVQGYLQSEVDEQRFVEQEQLKVKYQLPEVEFDVHEQGLRLLGDIQDEIQREKIDLLLRSCQETASQSILTAFGLSKDLFQDREGGNVQTINNAKKGIYASEDTRYSDKPYEYKAARRIYLRKRRQADGTYTDQYTGKKLEEGRVNLDHIIARKTHHDNGGFMQSEQKKAAFAQDERNFAITDSSLNKSKQDLGMMEFQKKTVKGQGENNKDRYDMDNRRVKPVVKRAEQALKDHQPGTVEKAVYYSRESLKHGVKDGAKMSMKQTFGFVMHELMVALVDEAKDAYRYGFRDKASGQSFLSALKERLFRAGVRVLSLRSEVLRTFGDGILDGVLTNFLTTFVNLVYTTSTRAIRMIRAGSRSLCKALHVLINPPAGMNPKQAAHESMKLLASGLVIAGGVMLEEVVEKWISTLVAPIPFLVPVVNTLVTVIVGILTGLLTVSVVYFLDKIDLFGINADREHEQITSQLRIIIDESLTEAKASARRMGLLT